MPKAIYMEIYKVLKEKIETGVYEYQEMLPSENVLIQEFDCSRNKVINFEASSIIMQN